MPSFRRMKDALGIWKNNQNRLVDFKPSSTRFGFFCENVTIPKTCCIIADKGHYSRGAIGAHVLWQFVNEVDPLLERAKGTEGKRPPSPRRPFVGGRTRAQRADVRS